MFRVKDTYGLFFLLIANHLTRFVVRNGEPVQPYFQRVQGLSDYYRGWIGKALNECYQTADGSLLWQAETGSLRFEQGELGRLTLETAEAFALLLNTTSEQLMDLNLTADAEQCG
jgi:hypothetical protein